MNRAEVEEDPSEDESIDAFKIEGTEALEVKGTEAFEKEGIEAFPSEVNYQEKTEQGQGIIFDHFLQRLTRSKVEMPTKEMLEKNPCCMRMLQDFVQLEEQPTKA